MSAGARYGLLLGLFFGLSDRVPGLAIVLWAALSIQEAIGLWITWRRLRLPWFLVGSVAALAVSLVMIPISARGLNLATMIDQLPLPAVVAIWLGIAWVPLSLGLEALRDSPEWRAWRARSEQASLWETITFRHVPDVHSVDAG
jgi:hypothetical protein